MFQAKQESFDAIVVGSGATGGWAVKQLTEAGMRVAMLEAGPKLKAKDFTEHRNTWNLPFLGMSQKIIQDRPIQGSCCACPEFNSKWFFSDEENPYKQAKPFHWIRMRILGGRSLSWGRRSDRMGPLDRAAALRVGRKVRRHQQPV